MTERARQEDHTRFLMREIDHRAKNMLAVVQAIARQTIRGGVDHFMERFEGRVGALAASQDLLAHGHRGSVALNELVHAQLAHLHDFGARIRISGAPAAVDAAAAQSIGMALYELATNACKYGALSNSDGVVRLEWTVQRSEAGQRRLRIHWLESGGPPVRPPFHKGFGSVVLESMMRSTLRASVELAFPPHGVEWRMECGGDHLSPV